VDPFGHGPVAPYLLGQAGLENTVVQRIHYSMCTNIIIIKKKKKVTHENIVFRLEAMDGRSPNE